MPRWILNTVELIGIATLIYFALIGIIYSFKILRDEWEGKK